MGRHISLETIRDAASIIYDVALRTPLVRLDVLGAPGAPEILLKLETLQPIGSFKIRGAYNAVRRLPSDRLGQGVWTVSAGNAAQGVALAARTATHRPGRYRVGCGVGFEPVPSPLAPRALVSHPRRRSGPRPGRYKALRTNQATTTTSNNTVPTYQRPPSVAREASVLPCPAAGPCVSRLPRPAGPDRFTLPVAVVEYRRVGTDANGRAAEVWVNFRVKLGVFAGATYRAPARA